VSDHINLNEQSQVHIVAKFLGNIKGANGQQIPVDKSALTVAPVMYDAVFIPSGHDSVAALIKEGDARHFVSEAFKHAKAIGAVGAGIELLRHTILPTIPASHPQSDGGVISMHGVVMTQNSSNLQALTNQFVEAIAQHRHWLRPQQEQVSA